MADGRRLNIHKAASLRNDVVEAGGRLLFGGVQLFDGGSLLRDSDLLPFECEVKKNPGVRRDALFKMARWLSVAGEQRWKIYYRSSKPQQLFLSDVCKLPSTLTLRLARQGRPDAAAEPVAWTDVRDVVMRER